MIVIVSIKTTKILISYLFFVEKKLFYEELANLLNNVFPFDSKTLYMLCLNHGIDIEVENKEMEDLTELFFEKLIKSVEELRKGIERYFSACVVL